MVVAILLVGGCGGGGSDADDGPATAVPAGAPFYLEVIVRPEGSLRSHALAAARKVLATDDPEARIRELVERAIAARGEDVDYERDLAPWLGERAAVWSEPSDRAYDPTVVLLAATDTDEASASLRAMLERGGHEVSERSYRGSEYLLHAGVAAGIVDDFAAIGPEAQYKRTVDAAEGDSLAETDGFAHVVGRLPDERLAHFWTDTSALLDRAVREDRLLGRLASVVTVAELPPVAGAFVANGDRLALDIEARGGLTAGGTPLVRELPGDSWAAVGAADIGESVRDALDRFGGPLGGLAIRGQLRRELGLELDRDLLDWIGDGGLFVRGTTLGTVDGGLVIQPTDEDRAAVAFGRIVGAVQQERGVAARPVEIAGADLAFAIPDRVAGRPIVLARGSGLVVAATGEAAAEAALGSGDRLGETDVYAEATELVGTEPSLLVSVAQLLELAAPEMRRHLEPFTVLAAGAEEDTARFAAGLR